MSGPKINTLATYYTSIYMYTDESSGSLKEQEAGKQKRNKNLNMTLKQIEKIYIFSYNLYSVWIIQKGHFSFQC